MQDTVPGAGDSVVNRPCRPVLELPLSGMPEVSFLAADGNDSIVQFHLLVCIGNNINC